MFYVMYTNPFLSHRIEAKQADTIEDAQDIASKLTSAKYKVIGISKMHMTLEKNPESVSYQYVY